MLSREGTRVLLGWRSSTVNVKRRLHPGDSTSSRLYGSVLTTLPENSRECWGRELSPHPPAKPGAIAMQTTLSLHCPDLLGSDSFDIRRLLSHCPSSPSPQSSRKEPRSSTASWRQTKMLAKLSPSLAMSRRNQELSLKDVASNDRRDTRWAAALASVSPSVPLSLNGSFQLVRRTCAETWVSGGCGERRPDGGTRKPEA